MSTQVSIALISGANTGIGLATATQLAKAHGYHVIIGSRKAEAGDKVASALVADGLSASSVELDICSDESIKAAVTRINNDFGHLDVLVNNAGILLDTAPERLPTRELFAQTLTTNVIGAACLTEAFLPLLRRSKLARLVFVSSRMGSVSEATNKQTLYYKIDYRAYDCSKAVLNMLALNYARILEEEDAMVNVVCPGLVQTKLSGFHPYCTSTDAGAKRIVELATAASGGETGTFSDANGAIPW